MIAAEDRLLKVPLDFYRILGVPIQATSEQIQQAYGDRLQQLPRIQYGEATITARKQILEQAYAVLSDPEQRQAHDGQFFAETYAQEPIAGLATLEPSGVEIQDQQLAGALLLLQELGEYELVLKLAQPVLGHSGILNLRDQRSGSPLSEADIVLTAALADLEIGRENWQKSHYEAAAHSLQAGLDLLLREGLFSDIQAEILSELYKLRPYRILELLAQAEEDDDEASAQGLSLLQAMLQERGGIDGTGNDRSGLSIEDFLRFIQQLRSHLSTAQQQELFEAEARRPSAVATYLAVYALVARGFSQNQPALIRRAKALIIRLRSHQDTYLEQAICALLLGQTQEVSQTLDQSQDYESVAFIREYSPDSPDLIPGLYLYTESWLKEEVYPYFRDLAGQSVSLSAYFANLQVQAYLEELGTGSSGRTTESFLPPAVPGSAGTDPAQFPLAAKIETEAIPDAPSESPVQSAQSLPEVQGSQAYPRASVPPPTVDPQNTPRGGGPAPRQARPGRCPPPGRRPPRQGPANSQLAGLRRVVRRRRHFPLGLASVIGLGILGMALVAIAILQLTKTSPSSPQASPQDNSEPPQSSLIASPSPPPSPDPQTAALTKESAKQVIQNWQAIKSQALGPNHQQEKLAQILTGPALTNWQNRANDAKTSNWHWQYSLNQLQVEQVDPQGPNQAKVLVNLQETAKFYQQGQLQSDASYQDPYRAQYTLVRKDGQWRIQDINVL